MLAVLHRVLNDDRGVTAIEYGFIASLIALVIAGVLSTVGGNLSGTLTSVASNL
jgi:pilus assembly protein Flp/PilA